MDADVAGADSAAVTVADSEEISVVVSAARTGVVVVSVGASVVVSAVAFVEANVVISVAGSVEGSAVLSVVAGALEIGEVATASTGVVDVVADAVSDDILTYRRRH